jgi:cyclic-di-GMP-binding protein
VVELIIRSVTAGELKVPSVDVVSKVDMEALFNAINNVKREISTRFDFRNIKSEVAIDRKTKVIHIATGDDWKVKAVSDMLVVQCTRFKVDSKCMDFKEIEATSQGTAKMDIFIKDGIPKETGQKIVKLVKGLKIKVQPAIQDNQVRLTGKKIDDLQNIMQLLREQDYDIPLQFVNMKS